MSVLEVLQTCPTQWKSLLSSLGEVDPADTRLITFDLDSEEPHLPSLVAFQIPVKIQNIMVHQCIIDEGASTCIMSKTVWQKLGSSELVPSAITLISYDGRSSSPEELFQNVPIELGRKTILIDIEVIDAPLDYNILFGRSYMYAMKAIASSLFRTMMFPHNEKIITIDQVSHYGLNHFANIDNILPLVRTSSDVYPLMDMGPKIFKDPSLLGAYRGAPPLIHPSTQVCVVSSDGTETRDTIPPTEASPPLDVPLVEESLPRGLPKNSTTPLTLDFPLPQGKISVWETIPQAITQITFFYTPSTVQSFQVATTLTLPNMVLTIPIWYLHPPAMVPQPSLPPQLEGIPMQIPVLTLTTPLSPLIASTTATTGGRQKKNEPTAPLPPRVQPLYTLCKREGHPTNRCPSLPDLHNLIQLPRATKSLVAPPSTPSTTTSFPTTGSKGL
jgi:hypothetical protein